jgi:hypothetical protein
VAVFDPTRPGGKQPRYRKDDADDTDDAEDDSDDRDEEGGEDQR